MKSAAAAHAVAPHLQELERQNAELRNHLAQEVRRNLDQRLAEAVPNFREIDSRPTLAAMADRPRRFIRANQTATA
jgi:hypothetical protein